LRSGKESWPVLYLQKANPTQDEDGVLTRLGMILCQKYAQKWLKGERDVDAERQYPDLVPAFYDIRHDAEYARQHAAEVTQ
jgi:hypothetical protein